jgi:hypothetical protein
MIEEFHERFLAKAFCMHALSKFAGYVKGYPTIQIERIEKNLSKRRGVVRALLDEGYLEVEDTAQGDIYTVTHKAFDETEEEPYIGALNIGSHEKPLATWLSAEVMKQAILDLASGNAVIQDCTRGRGKVVLSLRDARSQEEREFDDFLFGNFRSIVCTVTEMSNTFAENLRFQFTGVGAADGFDHLVGLLAEQRKEIQRLKRKNDALVVLESEVARLGGWSEFLKLARLQFLSEQSAKSA